MKPSTISTEIRLAIESFDATTLCDYGYTDAVSAYSLYSLNLSVVARRGGMAQRQTSRILPSCCEMETSLASRSVITYQGEHVLVTSLREHVPVSNLGDVPVTNLFISP